MLRHRVAVSIRLPYPPYLGKVIRRSAGIWLLVRIAYVAVLMAAAAFRLLPFADGVAAALHPLGRCGPCSWRSRPRGCGGTEDAATSCFCPPTWAHGRAGSGPPRCSPPWCLTWLS